MSERKRSERRTKHIVKPYKFVSQFSYSLFSIPYYSSLLWTVTTIALYSCLYSNLLSYTLFSIPNYSLLLCIVTKLFSTLVFILISSINKEGHVSSLAPTMTTKFKTNNWLRLSRQYCKIKIQFLRLLKYL